MPITYERHDLSIIYVVDGDTQDYHVLSRVFGTRKERCRILEIDTWETRGPDRVKGLAAEEYVNDWFTNQNYDGLYGLFWEEDSFGRWLIKMYKVVEGITYSLAEDLFANGHGVYYPIEIHMAMIRGVKVIHGLVPPASISAPAKTIAASSMHTPSWMVQAEWIDNEARRYGVDFDQLAGLLTERDFQIVDDD